MVSDRAGVTDLFRVSRTRQAVSDRATNSSRLGGWFESPRSREFEPGSTDQTATVARTAEGLRPRLLAISRRIVRCDDLAEDAVQEAMLGLWRLPNLPEDPSGWLVRAVVYRSLQILRSRKRRRWHEERACSCRREHDRQTDVHESLERRELADLVGGLLEELPESHRVVFRLREAEQLDYADIARALRIPIGTVRSRLNRTRKAIREGLERREWSPA